MQGVDTSDLTLADSITLLANSELVLHLQMVSSKVFI